MKKIHYYYLFFVTVLFAIITNSCDDPFLETHPKDKLNSAIFWQTPKDAEEYLNSLYGYLPGMYGEIQIDMLSDIGCGRIPGEAISIINKGEHDALLSYFQNQWRDAYRAINAANSLLENIDKIPNYAADKKTIVEAQARFIRAFFYLKLVMKFGNVPLLTKTISISEAQEVNQSNSDQIWDFIENELTEIASQLPSNYDLKNIGRITKGAALALNSRAMLYAGRFDKAANFSKELIDLNRYSLFPKYEKLFSYEGQNNQEVIFDRQYARNTEQKHNFFNIAAPLSLLSSTVDISPTRTLIDAFETLNGLGITEDPSYNPMDPYENRDPRLRFSVFLPVFSDDSFADINWINGNKFDARPGSGTIDEVEVSWTRTKTGFHTKKYVNIEDTYDRSNCGTNFIYIRYAEILLNYAEAKVELNQIDESVYISLNLVRNGRDDVKMPSIVNGKTQDELRIIIRNERLFELSLEGLRYWDIIRWGIAHELLQGPIPGLKYILSGETDIRTYEYRGIIKAFQSPRDYLFPIPLQEIRLNPNLVQNPGY